ncbi:MAG: hypothetical protein KTR30_00740 [Saprospiraceae bacterium]|nr:hypothetical protein [Saprospiraceae bacterium]
MGCQSTETDEKGILLAKVYNKSLYSQELDGLFPKEATADDSLKVLNSYVEKWVKEALVLHEAELHIPSDLNIDKLVRDYRASLIRNSYEELLVEELLDSTISQAELTEFYEKNKEQYQLETPIIRCHFLKVPLPVPEGGKVRRWWNSKDPADLATLIEYSNNYADAHILEDSSWYNVNDIAVELPSGTLTANNIGTKREFTQRDGEFQYFFRLFELKNRKEIAPLGYIEGQARKVILHKRKLKLLEDTKSDLYDNGMRSNNIQVITQ